MIHGIPQHKDANRRHVIWLMLIIVAAVLLRLLTFTGIVGTDDASIAEAALRVVEEGPYLPQGHYSARIGLIYPLAAIFAVAGVGEWQIALIPVVASILGVFLAFVVGLRLVNPQTGLIAAALVAAFPLDVGNASILMPDLPLGVVMAASFAAAIQIPYSRHPMGWGLLAGLIWGYAWLIKVEAFFMAFVFLALLWQLRRHWKAVFLVFAGAGMVVLVENLVYWVAGGEVLHRLHAAQSHGGGKFVEEFSETSLWVFPKAWFVTFYQFGLYYYALFAALIWVVVKRESRLLTVWVWTVVFLLWLQFGGNPFAENYQVKSHLLRYCAMVTVPMAVLIAAAIDRMEYSGRKVLARVSLAVLLLVGLFFVNFNTLSYEREIATKRALDVALDQKLFPLYLDRTSEAIAALYLAGTGFEKKLTSLQVHDFRTQDTRLLEPGEIDGYVLLNRGFMEYAWNRYRMEQVDETRFSDRFELKLSVDNPGNRLAYKQAKTLTAVARLIPISSVREKVESTGERLLRERDVVVLVPRSRVQ